MITSKSVESGFALADEFADLGLTIVPVANTTLAQLYSATNTLHCCYGNPEVTSDAAANGIEGNSDLSTYVTNLAKQIETNSTNAYRVHDVEMDNNIKTIRLAVSRHLDIAKNTVKPLVLELAEKTLESFNNDTAKDPAEGFNIECVDICPILSVMGFETQLKRYEGKVPAIPKARIQFKKDVSFSQADIENIVTDLYPDVKAELIDWFNNIRVESSTGNISSVLSGFINLDDNIGGPVVTSVLDTGDDISILNKLVCLYIASTHLYDNASFGIGYTLSNWKEACAQLRDYAGIRILQYLRRLGAYERSRTIILRTDLIKNTLYVHGPNYRQWLQNGGSPEILYAIMLNNEGMVTEETINASKASLLDKWKKYNVLKDVAFKNNRLQRFKDHLKYVFVNQLKELTPIEETYAGVDLNAYRNEVMRKFEDKLSHVKLHSMDDIYRTARKLICRCRFFFTSSDKILSAIEEYSKADERIDAQEASLMATIEYVADYVAEQLNVTTAVW